MKEGLSYFLKGAAMGAANVIPGVSGGTVAFITGIYERLINAIKAIDTAALKLILKGQFRAFAAKIDFQFLFLLGLGVIASIVTLAELLKYLFANRAVHVWAFFFGLIFASIYFVGKQVKKWTVGCIIALLVGTAIALAVSLLKPASENDSTLYLLLCGVVAMASMIIPGLSGSFVLLLLGNYQLIMIDSISGLKSGSIEAVKTLIPVGIGAVLGVVLLSRLLSWVFREFHDLAVSLLTGFVAGSLLIIWPWKSEIITRFEIEGGWKEKVTGYDWFLPGLSGEFFLSIAFMLLGIVLVWLMEKSGGGASVSELDSTTTED
jgi:putative membrane protein